MPFFAPAPCTHPIPYVLGTFDERFNISEKYFLSALAEAEAVWEKPFGRELFTYEPEDASRTALKVNLIYDYRQEATSKLKSLGIVVENTKSSYDSLKVKLITLKAEYEKAKNIFNVRVETFNERQKTYEEQVGFWNKKGGAPKDEYNKLEQDRLALNAEAGQLKILEANLNSMVDEINALVVVLNRLIDSLNLSVEKYNATNQARGESFEEGVYAESGFTREIDIYEFSSRTKLVRVLAHELGHALGLPHVKDRKAIMYELNQGSNSALTTADLEALNEKCQVK